MVVPTIKLKAQANEIQFLKKTYDMLSPWGSEHKAGALELSKILNISMGVSSKYAATLEELGILSRRMYYAGGGGREAYWKLLLPFNDALALLKSSHESSMGSASLRKRILKILSEEAITFKELNGKLLLNGGSTDAHNLTHVLYSLKRDHLIDFERGNTRAKIPYNIKLLKGVSVAEKPVKEVVSKPEPISTPVPVEISSSAEPQFPIILKLIKRREWLEAAARLAEKAGEEDISIMLDERISKPFTPLEAEAVSLYEAYMVFKEMKLTILE